MSIYLPEIDKIYFSKTKEYFQEVISSYSIGNYRSATVMLYSVAICDLLFKLQELKDMFNDSVAEQILAKVNKSRDEHDNKSKSRWEKELIDDIYHKTKLLDLEAYTNLNHLYDHRNFSAHPALNENYELIMPSKEVTIANIKNILKDILIKPPIFIKNIIEMLTEDLNGKGDLYKDSYNILTQYLNNKYYNRMPYSMKITTLKALWKLCFCLPEDENCKKNMQINRKALQILIAGFEQETLIYIKENSEKFSVAENDKCKLCLSVFLSEFPSIFDVLDENTKLQVESLIEKNPGAKFISWFKYKTIDSHLAYLRKSYNQLGADSGAIKLAILHYSDIGELSWLIDFLIEYYGDSNSYDSADCRFEAAVETCLDKMKAVQFERLIDVSNRNGQIWGRRSARTANNRIIMAARKVLPPNFDFSKYTMFDFDKNLLNLPSEENSQLDGDEELPI